jgi:hypothetical protein
MRVTRDSGFRESLAVGIARRPLAPVLAIAAIGAVVWYILGRALTLPQVFSDELVYFEAARSLAEHGAVPTYYGVVTPAVDSVAFLVASPIGAYHGIQLINSVAMASAAWPASSSRGECSRTRGHSSWQHSPCRSRGWSTRGS